MPHKKISNYNLVSNLEFVRKLNINYDLIKNELDGMADRKEEIENKIYYYKNGIMLAILDTIKNTLNIFYKVSYLANATISSSENRMGVLTVAKDFLVFSRDNVTGNLLCSPVDAAFLDLRVSKGTYKRVIENSIIANKVTDGYLRKYVKDNPNWVNSLEEIYHNSTDGYICRVGGIMLAIPKITKANNNNIGLNILSFNDEVRDLGRVESPVYRYYRKKRDWYYKHSAGSEVKASTENMKNCNFDNYGYGIDVNDKYQNLFEDINNNRLLK